MKPPRVLIVDDHSVNRFVGREIFEHLGCTVDTAESGEAALMALQVAGFDLVCLDRNMPGMSGDEIVIRLPDEQFVVAWSTEPSNLPTRYNGVLAKPITVHEAAAALASARKLLASSSSRPQLGMVA